MLTIGIDVGVTGAIAAITENGHVVGLYDLPVMNFGKAKWIDAPRLVGLIRVMKNGLPARAFVEHLAPMPKLGCVAANSKGLTLGSTLAALQISGVPFELITPSKWKRGLGLIDPESTDQVKKKASLSRARMLFPMAELHLEKHHNRGEALLLAHYGLHRATLVPQKIVRKSKPVADTPAAGEDLFAAKDVA
jgi:crossover junction endodeoxyribonuclease RuvC